VQIKIIIIIKQSKVNQKKENKKMENFGGAGMATHQCGLGSIPARRDM